MDDSLVREIKTNLEIVQNKIEKAALKVGRDPKSVRLIVVTKSQPMDMVKAAIEAGAKLLGESYAEEGVNKIIALENESGLEWHMIGHVQSRKANLIAMNFNKLHSLDGIKLAIRLDRFLGESGKELPVLLEFNVGGEDSKYGWQASDPNSWTKFLPEIKQILELPHLQITGLMTMPPFYDDPEKARPHFSNLRMLRDFLSRKFSDANWEELSMGTSSDYEIAVEEGATFIRIGQAILGKRSPRRG
ncbi:MAG: YggS family pyridoxal phosphate enzyme [Chloroflexi bacterium GWB2_49_20]|nr:MAG: YggS family pyridoxal phosphate enzyme [Chloroflexi bacterium GWB2_49_20]OGN78607.1 MAG: YggS family pyridoxal phosphate enzyme [Chloroflexi bacterium GWC2_49_37]OGN85709.1 MAG: YggS family pyridoxal phosphate enzyme [Chloroflexi bacterium GWD2_49_16]HBG75068.1 YggS family pyridoxal phosphate-dependent enzyme [Anaerolineae bacterium]HCC78093.1 YggS family pyridoxal phosphate-dependent enzyme [Anaerolineae bacterium]